MTTNISIHRADMQLEPVPLGRGRTVVADSNGQEVKLQIGVLDPLIAADKTTRFKVIGCSSALAAEQPVKADLRLIVPFEGRIHADRLRARILNIEFKM